MTTDAPGTTPGTTDRPDRVEKLSAQRQALLARLRANAGARTPPPPTAAPRARQAPPPVRPRRPQAPSPGGTPAAAAAPRGRVEASPAATGAEDRFRQLPPSRQALLRALRQRAKAGPVPAARPGPAMPSPLVALQPGGDRPPLVCAHAISGSVFAYLPLTRLLGPDQPLFGLEAPGFDSDTAPVDDLTALATTYRRAAEDEFGDRPFALLGWSMGGVLAYEIARQHRLSSGRTPAVVLVDAPLPPEAGVPDAGETLAYFVRDLAAQHGHRAASVPDGPVTGDAAAGSFDDRIGRLRAAGLVPADLGTDVARARYALLHAHVTALYGYAPGPYPGRLTVVVAEDSVPTADGWAAIAGPDATIDAHVLPGDHYSLWDAAHLPRLAGVITEALRRAGT